MAISKYSINHSNQDLKSRDLKLLFIKVTKLSLGASVSQYNPSYLGGWHQEDHGSRPAWGNSLQDTISKITRAKWAKAMSHAVESLLCKCKVLSSNPSSTNDKGGTKL
jgi:hypothetical protein